MTTSPVRVKCGQFNKRMYRIQTCKIPFYDFVIKKDNVVNANELEILKSVVIAPSLKHTNLSQLFLRYIGRSVEEVQHFGWW